MRFRVSPNIAVRTQQYDKAVAFYSTLLGVVNRSDDSALADFDAGPINLFVIGDDTVAGPVLELFVDDLDAAREELLSRGCEIVRWRGKGQDCYVRDPFGVLFNVWETDDREGA